MDNTKGRCRHFLSLTISNNNSAAQLASCQASSHSATEPGGGQPTAEHNWQQCPLICDDHLLLWCGNEGVEGQLANCNLLVLRRWKSMLSCLDAIGEFNDLKHGQAGDGPHNKPDATMTRHGFVDLVFFDVTNSSPAGGEVPMTAFGLLDEPQQSSDGEIQQHFDAVEKGVYEELSTVRWEGVLAAAASDESDQSDQWSAHSFDHPLAAAFGKIDGAFDHHYCSSIPSTLDEDYNTMGEGGGGTESAEEEGDEATGFILVGHAWPTGCHQRTLRQFVSDRHMWSSVRALCDTLPPKCTFRRLSLYQRRAGKCRYAFILLAKLDNAMAFVQPIANCVNNVRRSLSPLCPPINNNISNAYMDFYQEIEFEVDLEVIQRLVETAKSISCVGSRLVVRFGDQCPVNDSLPFAKRQTPFSQYRRGEGRRPSSVSSSFSTTTTADNDHLSLMTGTNGNWSSDQSSSNKSDAFDVEMEDIYGGGEEEEWKKGNRSRRGKVSTTTTTIATGPGRRETTGQQDDDAINNNNNNNSGGTNDAESEAENAHNSDNNNNNNSTRNSCCCYKKCIADMKMGHRNGEQTTEAANGQWKGGVGFDQRDEDQQQGKSAWRRGKGGRRNAGQRGGGRFSLLTNAVGTFWRKISAKG